MLHIHFSNRFEVLQQQLLDQLATPAPGAGLEAVFAADEVIVPSAAVQRTLTLAIARSRGLCANVRFSYLAPWLWRQIGLLLPGLAQESPLEPDALAWRVHSALADESFVAAHPRLAAYLGGADAVMRYELAQRVAALLEQYGTYRPDWLEAWRAGRRVDLGATAPAHAPAHARADEAWQAALWRQVAAAAGMPAADPTPDFARALHGLTPAAAQAAGLPARVHLMALPTMPSLHLDWLQRLAQVVEVHVHVLNPCQEYWFELIDRRRLAHLAARGRDALHEEGHRLLAGWGRQTQAFVEALVDRAGEGATDDADFRAHEGGTLLARLQNSMLELEPLAPGSAPLADGDRSVELHVCHSLTRELEVLQDHLLGLLARGEIVQASQVLVATPDLDAAAPLIETVFGTAPPDRRIPYAVTGRARSRVNRPAQALLGLLALAGSRLPAGEVFALLQQAPVARRFGLDDEALERVHRWLLDAAARWGLDGAHRASFDLPATAAHTWADALDRLFLGYALPTQVDEPFVALLPAGDAEGSDAVALGALWQFIDGLRRLHGAVARAHGPGGWHALLLGALQDFTLPQGDELDEQRELHDALAELVETMRCGGLKDGTEDVTDDGADHVAGDVTDDVAEDAAEDRARSGLGDDVGGRADADRLPLAVVLAALQRQLDDPARGGVPGGGVTFSSMHSLRSLPYDVVCVIGLNDGAFPTAQRPGEFDLMPLVPRRGDRQRRHDERNLFLDLLLAARHSLWLSHTGRSVRDNAPLPPSVLVSELLELLLPAVAEDPSSDDSLKAAHQRLVIEHPLQPFSASAFLVDGDARLRSHNRELGDALKAATTAAMTAAMTAPMSAAAAPAPAPARDAPPAGDTAAPAEPAAAPGDGADRGADADGDVDADDRSATALAPPPPFFDHPLATPGPEWRAVTLDQLLEFFNNPCRYLLRRRLGIDLARTEEELVDDEPFVTDRRAPRALAARLLGPLLAGTEAAPLRALAEAGLEYPAGALGRRERALELERLQQFAEPVRLRCQAPVLPPHPVRLHFELEGEGWTLSAGFTDLRPQGLLRWRYDPLQARDVLAAWLAHLALCAEPPAGMVLRTQWHATTAPLTLAALPPDVARQRLHELMQLYRRGLREPLEFFPRSAWSYVYWGESTFNARRTWTPTPAMPYAEGADAAYKLALRGNEHPLSGEFYTLAVRVFQPVMDASIDEADDTDEAVKGEEARA